jgi:hypothetical protein
MLSQALHRKPFRPFVMSLNSGETVRVAHPEIMVVGEFTAVILETGPERLQLIDIDSIARIELAPKVPTQEAS